MNSNNLISIGVPIYNEEKFIRQALDTLLSQSYQDIEIIVCDNASTDRTPEIIQEYMKTHANIKYYREDTNKGSLHNYIKAFQLSNSKYFMWAGGHDLWSSNLIKETVEQLESHPDAAIAFATTVWINELSEPAQRESGWCDTRAMHPIERFITTIWGNVHPVLGVMRSDYLKSTPFVNIAGTDLIILCDLSLKGDFIHTPKATCYRRELNTRAEESHQERMKRYQHKDSKFSTTSLNKLFPLFHLPIQLFKVIIKSQLNMFDKFYLVIAALPTFLIKYLIARKKKTK